jgi:hypothetical protein
VQEARLEGLAGATRISEVLARAAAALKVAAVGANAALRVGSRELRGDETLAEAGVPREGCVVEVTAGEAGGMPGCFGFGGQRQQTVDALRAQLREADAQAKMMDQRCAEVEARWKEDSKKSSETESHLKAELEAERRRRRELEAEAVERLRRSTNAGTPVLLPGAATVSAAPPVTAPVYGSGYLDKIVEQLEKEKERESTNAGRTEELSRQAGALLRLKAVMEARQSTVSSLSSGGPVAEGGAEGAEGSLSSFAYGTYLSGPQP